MKIVPEIKAMSVGREKKIIDSRSIPPQNRINSIWQQEGKGQGEKSKTMASSEP